jgi:hypothetical protein
MLALNPRLVEQVAFVLVGEPEEQRGHLLAQAMAQMAKYGVREGLTIEDAVEFAGRFGMATAEAMCRQIVEGEVQ